MWARGRDFFCTLARHYAYHGATHTGRREFARAAAASARGMAAGKFIVVEGLDRAGKSTQCAALAQRLRAQGRRVEEMKFPDRTTPIGQMLDAYLRNASQLSDEAVHLLFSANRWEAVPRMRELLRSGTWLVVDRYVYSGIAFSAAKGLDLAWCRAPDAGLPEPDLVVFLDVDTETASRRGGYGAERYENSDMQARVVKQFRALKDASWAWIDAAHPPERVAEQIDAAVASL